ncbi:glycosyltransferase [Jannaschia sp. Os4]|uniref:glycosyltransferase family 2 protein n=1 Tax=Jannaschia sp. Os4 TaxID=2807617 RepID=UPI00193A1738|nr:glycosyltransferase [Jannaschia sp. Os4]MBM2575807.1 glycosyltransferase [Jannaschia sp. Os4]
MTLSLATVIATRHRPDVLRLALPLHLSQSRLPARILVVDSSDDPGPTAEAVAEATRGAPVPVEVMRTAAGTAFQRNRGVEAVSEDVVFLPDDDSLLHPGAVEAIMRCYEADPEGRAIGAVCGAETPAYPGEAAPATYRRKRGEGLRQATGRLRTRLEDRLVPQAAKALARALWADRPAPPAGVRVEWAPGFRLSGRRDALLAHPFEERLGRYALGEDVDFCLRLQAAGLDLVAAPEALIHHHRAPGRRDDGVALGAIDTLHSGYIPLRAYHAAKAAGRPVPDGFARTIRRWAAMRAAQLRIGARDAHGRDRARGAARGRDALGTLLAADAAALDETYLRLRGEVLGTG